MKRALLLILTIVIAVLPLSACKDNGDEYSMLSYWEDVEGDVQAGAEGGDGTQGGDGEDGAQGTTGGGSTNKNPTGGNKKPVSSNVNELKGKTFTLAMHNNAAFTGTQFNSTLKAFEKKYGCKFEKKYLEFSQYTTQVSQRQSTGDSYDVLWIHGSFYPAITIAGVCEDLTEAINVLKPKNNIAEGTKLFNWKDAKTGKSGSYGYINKKCLNPYLLYYNKKLFEGAGLEDPLELYNKGEWTWDKILEMGRQVAETDTTGTYFIGKQFLPTNFMGGTSIYVNDDGVPVNNLRDPLVRQALEIHQKIFTGNKPIGMPAEATTEDYVTYFPKGKCYMIAEESSKWADLAPAAASSMAMGKSDKNLGIVPFPENSKGLYPTGWYTAYGAGAGSDPRVAILLGEFFATYDSPVKGKTDFKGDNLKLVNSLYEKDLLPNRHGSYQGSGSVTTLSTYDTLRYYIITGTDITKAIEDAVPKMEACLEATVGKGNYISK